jgi:glycine/D-amino acid oxidase-like deaminating enzyme/nitrite reductase/ring-hydroxylating ferredoxin subunit
VTQPLTGDLATDVCVVGGGIAGLSVAYRLSRAGKSVVLLESRRLGAGDTGETTAHLASALDERFTHLETVHGGDGARRAYESHQGAIEEIAAIVRDEEIDCDLERLDGYLFLAPGDPPELLDRELAAAHRAGFRDAERLAEIPGAPFASGPCLRFPRQGRFHPLRYLAGLTAAVERGGARIFTGSHVVEVDRGPDPFVRTREGFTVRARALVIATNVPIHDRGPVNSRMEPYRTYALAAPVPRGAVPDALWWDTADPYRYVRLQPGCEAHDLLIVGGEDHRTGEGPGGEEPWRRLEEWARERFPIGPVAHRWSGQVMEPIDGLAYIGRDPLSPEHVLLATGDSGHGMTHGALAGILISSLILGQEHPWIALYDPRRLRLRSAPDILGAGLHAASKYLEWLPGTGQSVGSTDDVPRGAGAILHRKGRPVAAYRDDAGALHERSAVCPHLGCIVHWNDAEKSWDCPCHGSRFGPRGEVIHGPARHDLGDAPG